MLSRSLEITSTTVSVVVVEEVVAEEMLFRPRRPVRGQECKNLEQSTISQVGEGEGELPRVAAMIIGVEAWNNKPLSIGVSESNPI